MKAFNLFVVLACAIFGAGNLFAGAGARPDLTGLVEDSEGEPVAKATVLIYTAGPKQGTSSLCPSCYADCQKKARTDEKGRFKIESLDPALFFQLLVVAKGHDSRFVDKVDPAKWKGKIVLNLLNEEDLDASLRVKGMVVGEDGKPISEALISPEGISRGQGTQWGGTDSFVEPMAVTDEKGVFSLYCKNNSVTEIHATAEGRGVAKQWVSLKPGADYLIRMREGVTVTGTLIGDGQPIQGLIISMITTDRTCGNFFNESEIATDNQGKFQMLNVPPDREFYVYSKMSPLNEHGVLSEKKFATGSSGTVQDLGKLVLQPAFKVSGRIVLSDGKPIPARTKILLGRETASDTLETVLGADGTFEFYGVPPESVSLWPRINGYQLSKRNPSLDWLNLRILGRVSSESTNLNFLMEPGQWENNPLELRPTGEDEYPVNKPLRGVKL